MSQNSKKPTARDDKEVISQLTSLAQVILPFPIFFFETREFMSSSLSIVMNQKVYKIKMQGHTPENDNT